MLIIRDRQMEAFARVSRQNFCQRAAFHLVDSCGVEKSEADLLIWIDRIISQLEAWGIDEEPAAVRFLEVAVDRFPASLDGLPFPEWVPRLLLASPHSQYQRIEMLADELAGESTNASC
jgi:hypothetical protein